MDKRSCLAATPQPQISPRNPFLKFTSYDIEQSVASRFVQIVDRDPSRLAVKVGEQVITYGTLNRTANRIAHALQSSMSKRNEPVAVVAKNDLPTIAAILGVAKAGKICVPLDTSFSPTWARFILHDTNAKVVLAGIDELRLAKSWISSAQILIDIDSLGTGWSDANPESAVSPDALSQILYTSGTTGDPKGVMDTHRNMLHYVMRLGNASHMSAEDRITLLRPPSSAGALSNLYLALLSGAAIFPADLKQVGLGAIAQWLRREKITIFHAGGTVFRHFAQQLTNAEQFPDLRLIRISSGQAYKQDLELFKRHFPDALLLHVLSSTETNTYRVHFFGKDSRVSDGSLPVGYPVEDMEVLILDDSGRPLGLNEVGEIAVRSDYIFPGYWHNSALTDASFVADSDSPRRKVFRTGDLGRLRPNGCLEYLGRKDFRVKIRGYRIQSEEVESALLKVPGISQAVVTTHKIGYGDDQLIAYVTLANQEFPTVSRMRESLKEWLPDYMLPSRFVVLERLPLNPNGKINRRALPAPALDRPKLDNQLSVPTTSLETALAKIWAEVLGIKNVGIHDPFFDLGGASITASKIVLAMDRIFPWNVTIADFYNAHTVARTAQLLVQKAASSERAERVAKLYLQVEAMSATEVESLLADERDKRQAEARSPGSRKE